MKICLICVSRRGAQLAQRIVAAMAGQTGIYIYQRYADSLPAGDAVHSFSDIGETVEKCFGDADALVFICSVGIAVRVTAPYIRSKLTDPAVAAVDENGRFAVSVLSGHIGGANELTERIAHIIGAQPVITTATDSGGRFSPDMFAKENDLVITDMAMTKELAALSAAGEDIPVVSEVSYIDSRGDDSGNCGILVTDSTDSPPPFEKTLFLLPRNIVLGVGCRKGKEPAVLMALAEDILMQHGIDRRRVKAVVSVDIKRDEAAVAELARSFGTAPVFFSADELMGIEGDFASSDYVKAVTGADNICERSIGAYAKSLGRSFGLIAGKTIRDGCTCAVGELYEKRCKGEDRHAEKQDEKDDRGR